MRVLIALCLVAAVSAGRLGYNYNLGSSGSTIIGSSAAGPVLGEAVRAVAGPVSYQVSPQSGVHKEFFSFHANEADFEDPDAARKIASAISKRVRVIFIKAPENRGYENAVLALAKQAAEQQTAIYLLHRQPDISELAQKFNAVRNSVNNKPEVHFVKYRTPEDAANAQRAIQSQYDSLGGSSQNINGGVADALNFASRSQAPVAAGQPQVPDTNYLPSSILGRLRS
ncbi:TwdlP, partial [Drosophila busckii]